MKKIILPIILILLASLVYASGVFNVEVKINDGWNIVAGTIPQDGISANSEIKLDDIEAMWYYSPLQNKYIQIYPNTDWDGINKDDEDFVLTNAMWVYSKKAGTLRYSTLEDYPSLNQRTLYSGWNFVTITPDMKGKSLNELKGNCNTEKIYHFESIIQEWSSNLVYDNFMDEKLTDASVGLGLVIKVSNNCNLGSTGGAISPPPIPNGGTSGCIDSDGGENYNTKGTVRKEGWDEIEDFCIDSMRLSEALCNNDGNPAFAQYSCPDGCSNGACI